MNSERYFLSSLESQRFEEVRECLFVKRMSFRTGKPCVLVQLEPPVIGQPWGIGDDLRYFVLATRHEGAHLLPVSEFPCFVFIARLRSDELLESDVLETGDVEIVAWGELYRTRGDAERHAFGPT